VFFYSESSTFVTIPLTLLFSTSSLLMSNTYIGTSSQSSFIVSSSGNTVETITLTDNSDQFSFSPTSFVLTGGINSQLITTTFTPTSLGVKTGNLILSSSGGNVKSLSFQGTGTDQYSASVSLMLKFDGENNSTNIVDSSINNLSITRYGDVKMSTVKSKFGSSSLYFDGNSDYIAINNSNQMFTFGSGNFTIEMWINPNEESVNGQVRMLFGNRNSYTNYDSITSGLGYNSTLQKFILAYYVSFDGATWGIFDTNVGQVTPNTWTHLAYVRNGLEFSVYINGIKKVVGNTANAIYNAGHPFEIGQGALNVEGYGSNSMLGYIEDVRITKGIARYTTNFTPSGSL
jgi:hypothetical protein